VADNGAASDFASPLQCTGGEIEAEELPGLVEDEGGAVGEQCGAEDGGAGVEAPSARAVGQTHGVERAALVANDCVQRVGGGRGPERGAGSVRPRRRGRGGENGRCRRRQQGVAAVEADGAVAADGAGQLAVVQREIEADVGVAVVLTVERDRADVVAEEVQDGEPLAAVSCPSDPRGTRSRSGSAGAPVRSRRANSLRSGWWRRAGG
jgi:hypothetical protein